MVQFTELFNLERTEIGDLKLLKVLTLVLSIRCFVGHVHYLT